LPFDSKARFTPGNGARPLITPEVDNADKRCQFLIANNRLPLAVRTLPCETSDFFALNPSRFAANQQWFFLPKTVFCLWNTVTHAF